MSDTRLVDLVDARDFRGLFIDELGWNNPDQPDRRIDVDQQTYTLTQVADHKGLRIWYCAELPIRKTQRALDELIGRDSHERLVIFADDDRQEWRWPRKAQTGGANAKLLVHQHKVGDSDSHLVRQLEAIAIDFDVDLSLVELLTRMRQAFDVVAEAASVEAARLMGTLYNELDQSEVPPHDATLLLARLLFLLFGDDTGMWEARLFQRYVAELTTDTTLHTDLAGLFQTLDTPEARRALPPGSPYSQFRYVNGGLFADPLSIPRLTAGFRAGLLSAGNFDWGVISPAVFGSMFQTVKDKDARRQGGEHYTTEQNILKTIGPLFLDEYRARLDAAMDEKGQLTKLHNDLGRLRFLDPACGCGNFLVVAYRELRALELDLLIRRRDLDISSGIHTGGVNRSQMSLDVTGDIKITLDHFYGIEIEEWPARIAETAMLLVDHLANLRMEQDFGVAPDRLPIALAPTIYHGNALRQEWRQILGLGDTELADDIIVVGNPPFIGMPLMNAEQQEDNRHAFSGLETAGLRTGRLDYVACWYAKAIKLLAGSKGRAAFVSTNSITQGEQARSLVPLLARHGFEVDFGHRTFRWTSEAPGAAVVHVVIVGFSYAGQAKQKRLFDYPDIKGLPVETRVSRLNFYLIDGPDTALVKVTSPIVLGLPQMTRGSQPTDEGHLFVSADELSDVMSDPVASKYLRQFVGAAEMLRSIDRRCLWLTGVTLAEIQASRILRERTELVAEFRRGSPTRSVRDQAKTPWLFTQIRQPSARYLAMPMASSSAREYIPAAFFEPDVIAGNALLTVTKAPLWLFGYLQSTAFTSWAKTFAGRLKSDLQILPALVYFPFPFIVPTGRQRAELEEAAQAVLDQRKQHPGATLAELYDSQAMPAQLRMRHRELDMQVDGLYGLSQPTEASRMKAVMRKYEDLT